MKDNLTNDMKRADEQLAQEINQVAEQIDTNSKFATELEERLRSTYQPETGWFAPAFRQVSPALRWVALMVLLGLVLSLSIKTLIPAPHPAADGTSVPTDIATLRPVILPEATATPATQGEGYDWRGTKLYLAAPLPELPAEANVYLLQPDQHATAEEARALAQQFSLEGEIYQARGELPDTTDYMITDGRQRLYVRSKNYFTYYADYNANTVLLGAKELGDEEAHAIIDAFLKSHGFDFDYQLEKEYRTPGIFYVTRLTADGYGIRFDYNMPSRWQVTIGEDRQVLFVDSSQIEYETTGVYGIRSAEEAFQLVLASGDAGQIGIMESAQAGGTLNESYWERSYPDGQSVTIYGRVTVFEALDPAKPAFVAINSYTATGNVPAASSDQLIEATGQFQTENGLRTFHVETWQPSEATETSLMGALRNEGGQTLLLSDMGDEYVIPDAPADVPLKGIPAPDEQLFVNGFLVDGNLIWTSIQYFPPGSNFGGGGGGGTGFYKLNLSGPPVSFPSPTAQPEARPETMEYIVQEGDTLLSIAQFYGVTPEELMQANGMSREDVLAVGMQLVIPMQQVNAGTTEYVVQANDTAASIAMQFGISVAELNQANDLTDNNTVYVGQVLFIPGQQAGNPYVGRRLEGQRGTLIITIYNQSDGSSRDEFAFASKNEDGSLFFAMLEDVSFEALLPYHHRPIDIWGTVKSVNENGIPVVQVEKYEAPYPGLTFQLIQGTQKIIEVEGEPAAVFTTDDGKSYIQMTPDGFVDASIIGQTGDKVYAEALFIPDETFGGYPVMRVFNIGMAVNPKNGKPAEVKITADQPYVLDEPLAPEDYVVPDATIEKVELAYYLPDPRYVPPDAGASPRYIQPVWRFYGHYSNGDVFEILVQALKQEYLLPEVEGFTPPG